MPIGANKRRLINVKLCVDGRWTDVGAIMLDENGMTPGFRYSDSYKGPPISPDLDYRVSGRSFLIPMTGQGHLRDAKRSDLHRVFEQVLPGAWAATVVRCRQQKFDSLSPAQKLWEMGDHRVGALYFLRRDERDYTTKLRERKLEDIAEARLQKRPEKSDEQLLQEILSDEREGRGILSTEREGLDSQIATYMQASDDQRQFMTIGTREQRWALTSNGGQQPKYVLKEADANGVNREYVVKLPENRVSYGWELPRVESAMLRTSQNAGLDTVKFRMLSAERPGAAVATERFDRTDDDAYRPIHSVNFGVLFNAPIGTEMDYADLALKIRELSVRPEKDVRELYGRMLFNAFTNNTDDHLAQFEMMHSGEGWKLAPNYDLQVENSKGGDGTLMRTHRLTMGGRREAELTPDFIAGTAATFKISKKEAFAIASRVLAAVVDVKRAFDEFGVSAKTQDSLLSVVSPSDLKLLKSKIDAGLRLMQDDRDSARMTQ